MIVSIQVTSLDVNYKSGTFQHSKVNDAGHGLDSGRTYEKRKTYTNPLHIIS